MTMESRLCVRGTMNKVDFRRKRTCVTECGNRLEGMEELRM
ncbi:hypothetical protein PIIN_10923 [Serendipita indica DSM 11827]|uniref:Uncharacterized protein n=1 Tax=Serendipita indica (strain DSM 11827) TaxID=1109443 RepID=G4U047_SERID|nr:hypothetical protein PIIN_10923 [Serendipita indica DSM 11827]